LGCTCTDTAEHTSAGAFALSAQVASVEGNASIGAVNRSETKASYETSTNAHNNVATWSEKSGFSDSDIGNGSHTEADFWNETSTAVASDNNIANAFNGAVGMFNVSQNVGNNSMQQASNTAAAIIGK
jgi:hypothetical protein